MDLPPLADLHRHLDGSLRESTLHELATQAGVSLPRTPAFHPQMGLDLAHEICRPAWLLYATEGSATL